MDWARFFYALLLSPNHFERAKEILKAVQLLSCISDGKCIGFELPDKCPVKTAPIYSLLDSDKLTPVVDELVPTVDDDIVVPPPQDNAPAKKGREKKRPVIVKSDVRRSPRMTKNKNGFKDQVCKDRNCLGCNSKPPLLSSTAIRKLSSSMCYVEASLVTDEALNKMKKSGVIGKDAKETKNKKNKKKPLNDVVRKEEDDLNKEDEA